MSAYMVVATFIPGTDMAEVMAVVKEEQAQVAVLTEQGRLGTINISLPRQTVFIEVVADDDAVVDCDEDTEVEGDEDCEEEEGGDEE